MASETQTLIDLLSFLGTMYHTYFGFLNNLSYGESQDRRANDSDDQSQLDLSDVTLDVCNDATNMDKARKYGIIIERTEQDEDDGCEDGFLTKFHLVQKLADTTVHFETVIVKYEKNEWFGELVPYWNSVSKWFGPRQSRLPFLSTRNWITVDEPFMQVTLSARTKGSPLTLDDILFATRALAVDDTRIYDSFKVLSQDETTLVLTPVIDNWSD